MAKDIKSYVYNPVKWQRDLGYTVNFDRCRYGIYGFRGLDHQCGRKPSETIQGYGFCWQHAAMVRQDIVED